MAQRLGIVMDPIESIKPQKDTTLGLMLEAQQLGYTLEYITPNALGVQAGKPYALSTQIEVADRTDNFFHRLSGPRSIELAHLKLILMRQDPPVDFDYLYVSYVLELAEQQGVTISNAPKGVRDTSEKLAILNFPHCIAPTLVSANSDELNDFIHHYRQVVIKSLWQMGGQDVYLLDAWDKQDNLTLDRLTNNGTHAVMAQSYLPSIHHGDKRVLLIHGQPVPYALNRLPKEGDFRSNLAAGGRGVGARLTSDEHWICQQVAPFLHNRGLHLVGLDIIGGYLTEINVTSPTCLREINRSFGINLFGQFFEGFAR
jgi:glutathione synthase